MATVVISGGTGGLGIAVTRTLLDAGWHAVVPTRPGAGDGGVEPHPELELI